MSAQDTQAGTVVRGTRGPWRRAACVTAVAALAAGVTILAPVGSAGADTLGPIDFESYATGSVNGQDGWLSTGPYDQAIADNSTFPGAPPAFGTQSLRISDAVTSGNFGNQTFSPATIDAAGEPTADAGVFPAGTRQARFTASFDFASVTPDAEQVGLHTTVSPDRGDGARMSFVRIDDSPSGWTLSFQDYVDVAPLGSDGDLDDGCGAGDGFVETVIATGVTRDPHTLTFVMDFADGGGNDVVKVLLDDEVLVTGTSWEDYFRYCGESGGGTGGVRADKSRIVRNLLFRQSGTAHPANAGAGFLIDDLAVETSEPALNLTSICTYAGGPYDGQHLWRVTSTYGTDKAYTSRSPVVAAPVARTATPGKSWFLGATDTTKISYTTGAGTLDVVKAANGSTCSYTDATIVTPPDGVTYIQDQVVAADFSCIGNELVSCVGTVADGDLIDTASLGAQTVSVTATGWDGDTTVVTHDYTVVAPPPGNGCNFNALTGAVIGWYPGVPGSPSSLQVACKFTNDTGGSMVSPSYTIHDMRWAQYHNGAARSVPVAAAPSGAVSLTADPGIEGTGMDTWVNRVITGPGLAPLTFVTSISGDTISLSSPTTAAVPGGAAMLIENAPGARIVADATGTPASTTIDSPSANFTGEDVGLSITGSEIPAHTTITAVNSPTQVEISAPATLTNTRVTIGGTLLTTTAREVTGAALTSATTISSTIAGFGATDVGLSVGGTCDQLTPAPGDDYTIPAGTYIVSVAAPDATTTGGLTAGQTGCRLTIGSANATAAKDGDPVANQSVQLNLSPDLVPGVDECGNETPEGIVMVGRWYNPGSFTGTGLSNEQPGPTPSSPSAPPTKAIGQIVLTSAVTTWSAFVVERTAGTPGDPIGAVHYDIVVPFAPTALALCPPSATSPGLALSLRVLAATPAQAKGQTLGRTSGLGRPGTSHQRAVLPQVSGGYNGTAYVTSDSGVPFSPTSAFERLCVFPTGSASPNNFQCGAG